MKRFLLMAIAVASGVFPAIAWGVPLHKESLYFTEPAEKFYQSLPLGNGRQGAMIFGRTDHERIVLNDISLWSGRFDNNADRPDASKVLPEIRRLLLEGDNLAAEALLNEQFTCAGEGSGRGNGAKVPYGCYQTLGDLILDWDTTGEAADYERTLDLRTAVANLGWKKDGKSITQEAFISAPDQIFVLRIQSDAPGTVSFTAKLQRPEAAEVGLDAKNGLEMRGQLFDGEDYTGMRFAAHLRVVTNDGEVSAEDGTLRVRNATSATLFVGCATDSGWPMRERGPDPVPLSRQRVDAAMAQDYDVLRRRHIEDYQNFYNRCHLDLASSAATPAWHKPTAQRLRDFHGGVADPELAALYFAFGRYLLISSSRPGGMPANLQGLWAEEIQTPWNGDYHIDINVQMNYWPAEVTGLGDCHEPMIRLIESLVENGQKTAKAYYDARGWAAHVITNPWQFTSPGEHASWGSTVSGAAWLCEHLWEHHAFNPDPEYLKRVWPTLKGSVEFFLDTLIEETKHQWLVTAPSNSPEHAFLLPNGQRAHTCMGPTIDMQVLRELFANTRNTAQILGIDPELSDQLAVARARLAPNQIGAEGDLQEWLHDWPDNEPHHRHVSHLYGLYPYDEITPWDTPDLAEAAKRTLEMRGDAATGWSLAWKICFWARLQEGNRAHSILQQLLRPSDQAGFNYTNQGGTYSNLFCAHPPFQIDGNFGATAGIAEMLVQSHGEGNVLRLLPALPEAWPSGHVEGLRARGGFEVALDWKDHVLTKCVITSYHGGTCTLSYRDAKRSLDTVKGQMITIESWE